MLLFNWITGNEEQVAQLATCAFWGRRSQRLANPPIYYKNSGDGCRVENDKEGSERPATDIAWTMGACQPAPSALSLAPVFQGKTFRI